MDNLRTAASLVFQVCFIAVLFAATGLACAQAPLLARIEALRELSERDNAGALAQLQPLWESFGSTTPYEVRREYLQTLMNLQVDAGRMDAAEESIARLLQLAHEKADDTGIVFANARSAGILILSGKPEAAISKLKAVEPFANRTRDIEAKWRFFHTLGTAQLNAGNFELALSSALKSLDLAREHAKLSKLFSLSSLSLLARVYMDMTNWEKALKVNSEALLLAAELDSFKMQAGLQVNRGIIYSYLSRIDDARGAFKLALKIAVDANLVGTQGTALLNTGDSYLRERNYVKAEEFSRRALPKLREAGDSGGMVIAQSNIGFALMGQGRAKEGAAEVIAALKFSKDSGAKTDEEALLDELSAMYEHLGMYRDALATVREQQKLTKELFRADRQRAVAELQEQFNAEQRVKQIELLARENSLKDAEISNQRLQKTVTLLGAVVTVMAGFFVFLLYQRVRKANAQLREANQQLEFHSVRDPLTGLFNRRSFLELMKDRPADIQTGRREDDNPDGLLILDVDHFKNINDTLGHAGGDAVLVEIADRLRSTVRDRDMVIRWGGEEFLIYSPKANAENLKSLAQRVLKVVAEKPIAVGEQALTITVTGGFLSLPFSGLSEAECNWEKAMQIADMALYLGKVNGRNRAYGLNRLLVPFAQAMPVLERDISAALKANMVELVEVSGPSLT